MPVIGSRARITHDRRFQMTWRVSIGSDRLSIESSRLRRESSHPLLHTNRDSIEGLRRPRAGYCCLRKASRELETSSRVPIEDDRRLRETDRVSIRSDRVSARGPELRLSSPSPFTCRSRQRRRQRPRTLRIRL